MKRDKGSSIFYSKVVLLVVYKYLLRGIYFINLENLLLRLNIHK